jgi:hypothetical protein
MPIIYPVPEDIAWSPCVVNRIAPTADKSFMSRALGIAMAATLVAFCASFLCLAPEPPAQHPDASIVRAAAERYLGAGHVTILQYVGEGGATDGLWWARIRLEGNPQPARPAAHLQSFARKHPEWWFSDDVDRGQFVTLHFPPPAWWKVDHALYSVRLRSDGGGFFAAPTPAPGEWNIMEYSR